MRVVLANQIADILDFNNNSQNVMRLRVVDNRFVVWYKKSWDLY